MTTPDTLTRRVDVAGSAEATDVTSLGGRMSFARLRKKLSQKELAEACDKSRASIVQYEGNKILPPLDVVQKIAKYLNVSSSYIAYGEHVVEGISHKEVEMVSFPEISFGRDGSFTSSTFAFAKSLIAEYGIPFESVASYVLDHEAPAFEMKTGERLIINTSITEPNGKADMYLLQTGTGMEVVRLEPNLGKAAGQQVRFTGPKGQLLTAKLGDLTILGAIVATIRRIA